MKRPVILAILDGWGEWDISMGNAIANANLPNIDRLNKYYPKLLLQASGLSVGLPWGVKGNSEVGHQAMGTGQIIFQYLPAIDMAISDGGFKKNEVLNRNFDLVKKNNSSLHILGLISNGGVHSHINHLIAILDLAKEKEISKVFIHAITDGRDTSPQSAKEFIEMINAKLAKIKIGKIATLSGRYYTMDRNNNWDRIEKSFRVFTEGNGIKEKCPLEALDNQYARDIYDERLEPVNIVDEANKPIGLIAENDTVLCFNFRKDRSRQISEAFISQDFDKFSREVKNINFLAFTNYKKDLIKEIVFPPQEISARLGEEISKNNKNQLRIAETEKYAHVTYFFNGGNEKPFPGEDRVIIPSKKVSIYSEAPEMSAYELTDKVLGAISENKYDFILINFANPDMVGHTGDLSAGVRAVETVDECLGKIIDKILKIKGTLLISADHGNIEEMIDTITYKKDTEHSTNPVPAWLVSLDYCREKALKSKSSFEIEGMIVDIPPTILDLLGIEKNKEMTGVSLLNLFKKKI